MMALSVESCLWAAAGAVTGAALTGWMMRRRPSPADSNVPDGDTVELIECRERGKAWEAFAVCAISMIPVLIKQMEAVTRQTEQAAMDLMIHIRSMAAAAATATVAEKSTDLSKVVMAMQFQDITRQKLEHVSQAMGQLQMHLSALLKGPLDVSARKDIAELQRLEESYTTAEERRLHATVLAPDYQEPVPIDIEQSEEQKDSVTLF